MVKRRDFLKKSILLTAGAASIPATAYSCKDIEDQSVEEKGSISFNKKINVKYDMDVVVVGGGMAGISAACSAAATGAKVLLIERFGCLGGMLTTGGVANFCGQMHDQGEVFDEMLNELKRYNSLGEGSNNEVFNYELLTLVFQEMILKRSITVLLHTRLVDAIIKGSNITECIICGKSGLEAVKAKVFIDCSGEADLARYAGVSIMKGNSESGYQLPMSKMFFVREVDEKDYISQVPQDWKNRIFEKDDMPMTTPWPDGPGGKAVKLKIPMFDSTSTESLTNAEIQARRRTMDVLHYYQEIEKKKWRLTHSAAIIGIREGCRVLGDYVLTVEDLRAGRAFDDGVARGTYYLDGHGLTDDKRTYILPQDKLGVPPYQIPMRSLISKDADNLLMAGRCMSADQLALSSARVSTSCSMMGQAAGIAAAFAVAKKTKVRNLDYLSIKKEVILRGGKLDV